MGNGQDAVIVVGVDGSEQSVRALRWAARLAPELGAG
ncbi:universal stress protein, partial [Streptomyces sp.]